MEILMYKSVIIGLAIYITYKAANSNKDYRGKIIEEVIRSVELLTLKGDNMTSRDKQLLAIKLLKASGVWSITTTEIDVVVDKLLNSNKSL